jgi:hypothetical protein
MLLKIFLWLGSKLFKYVDIYSPDNNVIGITFSNNEDYIEKISNIE